MSISLDAVYPPQPSTERARRTPLSYNSRTNQIAYASNKLVVLRDVEKPETASLLFGEHVHQVTTVNFSPDGYQVASGDASGQVKVWNLEGDLNVKGPYMAISGKVFGVAFCGEGERVIAVGDGKERFGHCFTADSGNTVGEISGHSAFVNAVAIKPTRPMRAVTVGEDGKTVFYKGPPFRFDKALSQHVNAVSDVAYSPSGELFVTCGVDRKLAVYDGSTGDFIRYVETKHEGMILSVAFVDNDKVLSASADCTLRLSSIEGKLLETFSLPKEVKNQLTGVVNANGTFVTVALNGDIYFFKQGSEKPVRVVQGHQKQISALAISKSLKTPFTGSVDGTVVKWEPSGVRVKESVDEVPVAALVGDLTSVGWDKKLEPIVGNEKGELEHEPVAAVETDDGVLSVSTQFVELKGKSSAELAERGTSVHAVGKLAVVGFGNQAAIYSLPDLKLKHTFEKRQSEVSQVAISPDTKYVAIGDASGKITVYNLEDFSLKTSRWAFHTSRVTGIEWSENSLHAVTCSLDTNIYVYSIERPARNVKFLNAHKEGVTSIALKEKQIISAGIDGAVKLWKWEE